MGIAVILANNAIRGLQFARGEELFDDQFREARTVFWFFSRLTRELLL